MSNPLPDWEQEVQIAEKAAEYEKRGLDAFKTLARRMFAAGMRYAMTEGNVDGYYREGLYEEADKIERGEL